MYKPQFRQKRKRSRSPAGPRRLGTATRISASLSRRLSASFRSASDQAPKAAKFAVLPPGHAGFPNRVKRSEGSDTTHASHTRKTMSAGCTNRNFGRSEKDHAAQRGRDAFETATRISASLFRRLSAFFGSTSDQGQKAAKYAVLTPGRAGFPNRAKRSEGSDTTPRPKHPCFGVCALVCDFSLKGECVPAFGSESKRGAFVREVENRDEKRFGTALWR